MTDGDGWFFLLLLLVLLVGPVVDCLIRRGVVKRGGEDAGGIIRFAIREGRRTFLGFWEEVRLILFPQNGDPVLAQKAGINVLMAVVVPLVIIVFCGIAYLRSTLAPSYVLVTLLLLSVLALLAFCIIAYISIRKVL